MTTTEITTEPGNHSRTHTVPASTTVGDVVTLNTGWSFTEYTVTRIVDEPRNAGKFAVATTGHTDRWFKMV